MPCEAVLGSNPASAEQGWSLIRTICPVPASSCAGSGQNEGYEAMSQRRNQQAERQNNASQNLYLPQINAWHLHHHHLHGGTMGNWWQPSLVAVIVISERQRR